MGKFWRQLQYTFQLYRHRFFQMRTGILLILLFGAMDLDYMGLARAVKGLDYPASPWFILSVMTNDFMCAAVGLGAVYLFSGAPYLNRNGMYQMIRVGKRRWAAAQLGSILVSSFSFTLSLFLMGLLHQLPRIDWTVSWGKMLHTLSLTNAAQEFDVTFGLSYSFLQQIDGWQAALLAFGLDSLVFTLLGFLLFGIGLCFGRTVALTCVGFLAVLPFSSQAFNIYNLYWLHMISPVSWLQTGLFFTKNYIYAAMPPVTVVFGLSLVYIVAAIGIASLGVHRNQFKWNGETE